MTLTSDSRMEIDVDREMEQAVVEHQIQKWGSNHPPIICIHSHIRMIHHPKQLALVLKTGLRKDQYQELSNIYIIAQFKMAYTTH